MRSSCKERKKGEKKRREKEKGRGTGLSERSWFKKARSNDEKGGGGHEVCVCHERCVIKGGHRRVEGVEWWGWVGVEGVGGG